MHFIVDVNEIMHFHICNAIDMHFNVDFTAIFVLFNCVLNAIVMHLKKIECNCYAF